MKLGKLHAVACVGWLTACADVSSGPAEDCAEAVGIYKGLQGPVEIVGPPSEPSEGRVQIEYRGMDAMNLPAQGTATCRFAVDADGATRLLGATVDGSPVDGPEIDAIRHELATVR